MFGGRAAKNGSCLNETTSRVRASALSVRGADPAHSPEDKVTFLHLWSLRGHSVHWPARPDQLERGDATSTATATPRPRWAPAWPSRPPRRPFRTAPRSRQPGARRTERRAEAGSSNGDTAASSSASCLKHLPPTPTAEEDVAAKRQVRPFAHQGGTAIRGPARDDPAVSDPAQATARDAAFTSPQLSGLHETSRAGTHSDNIRRTQHIKSCFAYHPDVSTAQNPWTATVLGQACPGGA